MKVPRVFKNFFRKDTWFVMCAKQPPLPNNKIRTEKKTHSNTLNKQALTIIMFLDGNSERVSHLLFSLFLLSVYF